MPSADDVPARPPRWLREARATPDGSHVHLEVDRWVRRPALPLRHRHGYAADLRRGLPTAHHIPAGSSPPPTGRWIRTAPSPYPPSLSWWAVKGRQTLVPLVRLPISLTGPAPSGSTGTSRRCRGCSHPHRRLPDQAAPSFTRPLRWPDGKGLSPPLDSKRLVAHVVLGPVDATKQRQLITSPLVSTLFVSPGEVTRRPNRGTLRSVISVAVRDSSTPQEPRSVAELTARERMVRSLPAADSGNAHPTTTRSLTRQRTRPLSHGALQTRGRLGVVRRRAAISGRSQAPFSLKTSDVWKPQASCSSRKSNPYHTIRGRL